MSDEITYNDKGDAVSFNGPSAVNVFRMAAIASGLRLYAATGIKPNRAWTPTNMLRAAGECLGCTFKRGEYLKAADALSAKVQEEKTRIAQENAK